MVEMPFLKITYQYISILLGKFLDKGEFCSQKTYGQQTTKHLPNSKHS